MISTWMLFAVLVAVVLSAAAWTVERALREYRVASRWIWTLALIASVLFPLATLLSPGAGDVLPAPVTPPEGEAYTTPGPLATSGTSSSAVVPVVIDGVRGPTLPRLPRALDPFAMTGWLVVTIALAAGLLRTFRSLRHLRRVWLAKRVDGRDIFVSEAMGPALVGVLRPSIVMPRWALDLAPRDRELMLRHEEEHKLAGDAPLLFAALIFLVLLPWNLPLWWQLRRLRLAVEVDCDRRVLERTRDLRRYAALLVEIGRRRTRLPMSIALAEPASFLERRIHAMTNRAKPRHALAAASLLAAGMLTAAVAAFEPPVPPLADVEQGAVSSFDRIGEAGYTRADDDDKPEALRSDIAPAAPRIQAAPRVRTEPADAAAPSGAVEGGVTQLDPVVQRAARIRGRVSSPAGPLVGVQVSVVGADVSAVSRESDGTFLLPDVPPGDYTVRAELTGWLPAAQQVTAREDAETELTFVLEPDRQSELWQAIIRRNEGRQGPPPIIYIDGVRQPASSDTSSIVLPNRPTSVAGLLAGVPTNEIERIEVVRGEAAVQRFGADAANGVILIFTRRRPPG